LCLIPQRAPNSGLTTYQENPKSLS